MISTLHIKLVNILLKNDIIITIIIGLPFTPDKNHLHLYWKQIYKLSCNFLKSEPLINRIVSLKYRCMPQR